MENKTPKHKIPVRPSILDRLIDDRADVYGYPINLLIESLRRDLENLLNTPKSPVVFGPEFVELHSSILDFGIPDVASATGNDSQIWEKMISKIEFAIRSFEPRLKEVEVIMKDNRKSGIPKVEFEIRGQLVFDPSPELLFQSTIELSSGRTLVNFPTLEES